MPDAPEIHSLNADAARAAAEGDFNAATALLRQVLHLQHEALGTGHPDIATTLNNLALMRERAGDLAEAGVCYRRAHAVAAKALPPGHPLVRLSDENLNAFYAAYGGPGVPPQAGHPTQDGTAGLMDFQTGDEALPEPSVATPVNVATPAPRSPAPVQLPPSAPPLGRQAPRRPAPDPLPVDSPRPVNTAPPGAPRREVAPLWRRPAVMAAIGVALLIVAAVWRWGSEGPPAPAMSEAPVSAPAAEVAATPERDIPPEPPVAADPPSAPPSGQQAQPPTPQPRSPQAPTAEPTAPASAPRADAAAPGAPSLVKARVCRTLSRQGAVWTCQPVANPVQGGAVSYYTRVASPRDVVIRHRWSRDGTIVRVSSLRVGANPTDGYRTFSSQTVGPGEWEVALLGPDDRVLDEQHFVVR